MAEQRARQALMTTYRRRRCPWCGSVFPGGRLRPLRYGTGHYHEKGGSLRRCPGCGHKGFTQDFKGRVDNDH